MMGFMISTILITKSNVNINVKCGSGWDLVHLQNQLVIGFCFDNQIGKNHLVTYIHTYIHAYMHTCIYIYIYIQVFTITRKQMNNVMW